MCYYNISLQIRTRNQQKLLFKIIPPPKKKKKTPNKLNPNQDMSNEDISEYTAGGGGGETLIHNIRSPTLTMRMLPEAIGTLYLFMVHRRSYFTISAGLFQQ